MVDTLEECTLLNITYGRQLVKTSEEEELTLRIMYTVICFIVHYIKKLSSGRNFVVLYTNSRPFNNCPSHCERLLMTYTARLNTPCTVTQMAPLLIEVIFD